MAETNVKYAREDRERKAMEGRERKDSRNTCPCSLVSGSVLQKCCPVTPPGNSWFRRRAAPPLLRNLNGLGYRSDVANLYMYGVPISIYVYPY
jgi:hypothetical protein